MLYYNNACGRKRLSIATALAAFCLSNGAAGADCIDADAFLTRGATLTTEQGWTLDRQPMQGSVVTTVARGKTTKGEDFESTAEAVLGMVTLLVRSQSGGRLTGLRRTFDTDVAAALPPRIGETAEFSFTVVRQPPFPYDPANGRGRMTLTASAADPVDLAGCRYDVLRVEAVTYDGGNRATVTGLWSPALKLLLTTSSVTELRTGQRQEGHQTITGITLK